MIMEIEEFNRIQKEIIKKAESNAKLEFACQIMERINQCTKEKKPNELIINEVFEMCREV